MKSLASPLLPLLLAALAPGLAAAEPALPRVLLIGDSISIGYTAPVRQLLAGRADVRRVNGNASSSGYGLEHLDRWLTGEAWAVIHFNFGIHDAKLPPEGIRHASVEAYAANLRRIVARLKATGARLVWATSTPIPLGGNLSAKRRFADITAYNAAAERVMRDEGVAINDLHAAITPRAAEFWKPRDLHFTPAGYDLLAEHVARAIRAALPPAP